MRRLLLLAGLCCAGAGLGRAAACAWRGSFAAHMVAHMGVVAVAAPLLAVGLFRADRPLVWEARCRCASCRSSRRCSSSIVVWGWHAPAMRAWRRHPLAVTAVEQLMFLACGLAALDVGAPARDTSAAGAFGLLLTSMHMTLLGALLALSPRPLYGAVRRHLLRPDAGCRSRPADRRRGDARCRRGRLPGRRRLSRGAHAQREPDAEVVR